MERDERLITLQVYLRIVEVGLVPEQSRLCVLQHDLIRPGINFRQRIAFVNKLAFLVEDLHQVTGNLAFYRYSINRRDSAQPGKIDADVAFGGLDGNHRNAPKFRPDGPPAGLVLAACGATIPL